MREDTQRIVITGIGPISSLGIGQDEMWNNALIERINLVEENCSINGQIVDKHFVHKIHNFQIDNFGLDPLSINEIKTWKDCEIGMDLRYFLATIKLAIDDSKLQYDLGKNDIGLVLSAESPGHGEFYEKCLQYFYPKLNDVAGNNTKNNQKLERWDYKNNFFKAFKKIGYDLQTFTNLFHIGKVFNLHGYSLQINNACASGLFALEIASDLILSGKCSAVIVAAVDQPDIFKYLWFKEMKIYSENGKIKPFSQNADGFVLGEGGAAFIIENLKCARERKAEIYAEYLGGGFNMEAWKVTFPAIDKDYYQAAIHLALKNSKINLNEIDLVVPHGVGTKVIDKFECRALDDVFRSNKINPLISAFKPYIGHNLGGCTLIETTLALLCLKHEIILPIINSREFIYNDRFNFVTKKIRRASKLILKTCSAFAGFNAAAILRRMN